MSALQGLIASIGRGAIPAASGTRILELDAYTYSGTGPWQDLSAVGSTMTFGNNVSYSGGSDRWFDFIGTGFGTASNTAYQDLTTLTAAIWINLDTTSFIPPGGIPDHTLIGGNTWALRMDNVNQLNLVKYYQTDQAITVPSAFTAGTWYHIVAAMDFTETRYYINGVKVGTYTNSQVINPSSSDITIGTNNNLNAKVRKAQVYNFALSDTAVAGLYNSECQDFGLGLTTIPASVVAANTYAYFDPLTYAGTGNLPDLSAHNRDMVLTNTGGSITRLDRNRGTLVSTAASTADKFRMPGDLSATNSTIMIASRYNSSGPFGRIMAADNNWLLGHWGAQPNKFFAGAWVNTTGAYGDTTDQTWRIYTGWSGYASNTFKYYVNGQLDRQVSSGLYGPSGLSLFGNNQFPGEYSAGTVGVVIVWDRLLSDAEVAEAYEYFRCRYGI